MPAGHASGRDQPRLITWKRPALSNLPCWKVLGSAVLAVLSCLPAACDTIRAMDSKRAAKPSVSAPPDRPQMSSGHHVRTRLGGAPPTFFGGSTVERASSRSAGGPYCPMHGHVKVLQPRSGALEQITDALRCKQHRRRHGAAHRCNLHPTGSGATRRCEQRLEACATRRSSEQRGVRHAAADRRELTIRAG